MLCQFKPKSIFDMSLITAALRPSGASYRDMLMQKEFHKNPSTIIDEMLKDNYGYLIYQEDTIKFLKDICGLSGSEADNIRRAIGRKQKDRLDAAMPSILEGYCRMSTQPREIAEQEAKEFLQIIEDSASYQFGMNHSVAYCMIGYLCAYLRYYYTPQFITSYLNNADNEDDIIKGFEMAKVYKINILPPRFRYSREQYVLDTKTNVIYKGVASIKFLNKEASEYLYSLRSNKYNSFVDLLIEIESAHKINSRQMEILIQLQYFEEFGKNKKLLSVYKIFKALYGKKQLDKSKISDYSLTNDIVYKFATKETEKMFYFEDVTKQACKIYTNGKGIINYFSIGVNALPQYMICRTTDNPCVITGRMNNMLKYMEKSIPDECFSIQEQIKYEGETLGYISMIYDIDKRYCYVTDLDTKYSPRLQIYSLSTGKSIQCKINKGIFSENPIKRKDIIFCMKFIEREKQVKTANGWEKDGQYEWWLVDYKIANDLKV